MTRAAAAHLIPASARRWALAVEYLILFYGGPALFALLKPKIDNQKGGRYAILLALWFALPLCLYYLLKSPGFDRSRFTRTQGFLRELLRFGPIFLAGAATIAACVWLLAPDRLFLFVRNYPARWALIMALYPILSVYPQGIIYRGFLFHRYRELFDTPAMRIVGSAMAFSFMHVVFRNNIAVGLTLGGGLLFAWTYERSKSMLTAAVEHALYGCFIWTIGLGPYFLGGTLRLAGNAVK